MNVSYCIPECYESVRNHQEVVAALAFACRISDYIIDFGGLVNTKANIGNDGELILDGSGRKFDDAGFYFVLKDAKGKYWSHYISSFRDKLIIGMNNNGGLVAKQTLSL